MISFILNLPYTLIAFLFGLSCFPTSIKFNKKPFAIILKVRNFWWKFFIYKTSRAMAAGNTILLGPLEEENDLKHELIHVKQGEKLPFIFPIFYYYETFKHGYRKNRFEDEAYRVAGNVYKGK